jgi:hypothetical protein
MKENCYGNNFDRLKEEGDGGRLNKYSEKKSLFEGVEEINQAENNLTGKIENPSSPNGSTGESENFKNSEKNEEKIENKNEKIKFYITPKENKKKVDEDPIEEIKDKSEKFIIYPTPKENEKKMNEDSIEKNKEAISSNIVKSGEKNMNLLEYKEPVGPFNMIIDSESEGDIDMENDNDDYQSQIIYESIIGSNQNEQEINFSTVSTVRTNQGVGGEDYVIIDENNPLNSFPVEDDDNLNSSDMRILRQIECNHHH